MKSPLVTVIVANYNYARYLPATIQSVLNQTYKNIELIVVDDGSTDNSLAELGKFENANFQVLSKTNGGQASALNLGFASSRGEIVLFLDSDDTLLPLCAERLVDGWLPEFSKLHFALRLIDEQGRPKGGTEPPGRKLPQGRLAKEVAIKGGYLSPPCSGNAYSRRFLEQIMPIPEHEWRGYSDVYLFNLAPFFGTIGAINEELGCYRVHAGSMSVLVVDGRLRARSIQKDILVDEKVRRLLKPYRERELGQPVDEDEGSYHKLRSRLISLKLARETHPIKGDTLVKLFFRACRRSWLHSEQTIGRRLLFSVWILLICLFPKRLAEMLIVPAFQQRSCVSVAHG